MKSGQGWPVAAKSLWQYISRSTHFCCFCHQKTDTSFDLCRFCQSHLPQLSVKSGDFAAPKLCLYCGRLANCEPYAGKCADCAKLPPIFTRIICPYRYDFPINQLLHRLKYQNHLPTARLLGSLLAEQVLQENAYLRPEILLPVPSVSERHRKRGFNQAHEIAKWCGQALDIDLDTRSLGRHSGSPSLVGLSRAERALAIRGCFWVDDRLAGKRVAIIDDVLTSGATTHELATELKDTGVSEIQLWVLARTPMVSTGSDTSIR